MKPASGMTPPLSPVLLAGLAARPLPPAVIEPLASAALAAIHRRHPGVFERLDGIDNPSFRIDPVDLPFVFLLRPDPERPTVAVRREADDEPASATIRGPLLALIELLEGRIDGDALFFSRELVIEGDTEAVVALRNAVDGAEIDLLGDVLSVLGPFAGPARRVAEGAASLAGRFAEDLETLRAAVIAPAMRKSDAQAARIKALDEKIDGLTRTRRAAPGKS